MIVEVKEEVKIQRTAEEVVEFFKIPAMAELYFPDVTYEQVKPLFPLASQRFHHERVYSETWTYYALQNAYSNCCLMSINTATGQRKHADSQEQWVRNRQLRLPGQACLLASDLLHR